MDKNNAYEGAKILFEDEDLLIIQPRSASSAVKYFSSNVQYRMITKLPREIRSYEFIYIIPYKKTEQTFSYTPIVIINSKYDSEILDSNADNLSVEEVKKYFPKSVDIINSLNIEKDTLSYLKGTLQGDPEAKEGLFSSEPFIYDIAYNKSKPAMSKITLLFDSHEDFFNLFDDLNEEDMWAINRINSNYIEDAYYNYDTADDDWKQGYIIREFSQENMERVYKILEVIDPSVLSWKDADSDKFYEQASEVLERNFERQVSSIVSEYTSLRNQCAHESSQEDFREVFGNLLNPYGIVELSPYYKYRTTVGILIFLFEKYKPEKNTIKSLINKILERKNLGGWGDSWYEYDCTNFDNNSFQREIDRELDRIDEKVEDLIEKENVEEYKKITDIFKKYQLYKTYNLPRNQREKFKIQEFLRDKLKLKVQYIEENGEKHTIELSPEEFNNFLVNYTLFE